jgi:hypothetical protein
MTCIDRAFCTIPWEDLYVDPTLHAMSSSVSNHVPLLLMPHDHIPSPHIFRFEIHWLHMPGFADCVQAAWNRPIHNAATYNAFMILHIKLSRTTNALSAWARKLIPQGKLTTTVAREVIAQLESAQESRALYGEEVQLCKHLKK